MSRPKKAMSSEEIIEDLAERIRRKEYPPHSKLPTYRELAELYSVHPASISTIIVRLKERGLVYGVQGKGVFVSDGPTGSSLTNPFSV